MLCCFSSLPDSDVWSSADDIHVRIQEFLSTGGPGQFFLVLSLFYRSQMVNFKKTVTFKVPEGVQHFPGGGGGSNFFQGGGGGSNCL